MAGSHRPGPAVEPPPDADPRDLAPEVRSQLRTLSKLAADRVARHLVAAGRLVDVDPRAALAQARAARALGARVAVVREAVGETAYAAGEWAEAIAELRTARRMTGDDSALPLLADAERALGRPDRALRLAQSPQAQALPPAARAEMRIVEAGARRDQGQLDAALVTLQGAGLDRRRIEPWSPRLWYAYADTLLASGRVDEARDWFHAAATADDDGVTDADERLLELDGVQILADDELADDELADDDGRSPATTADDLAP
jgi:tetratricopeptide (TPR) repeat protein